MHHECLSAFCSVMLATESMLAHNPSRPQNQCEEGRWETCRNENGMGVRQELYADKPSRGGLPTIVGRFGCRVFSAA